MHTHYMCAVMSGGGEHVEVPYALRKHCACLYIVYRTHVAEWDGQRHKASSVAGEATYVRTYVCISPPLLIFFRPC